MKNETLNVKAKLLNARKGILTTKVKKEGKNTFSKYDYFTPSQITNLVTKACIENNLITTFSVFKKENDYYGVLFVTDTDSDDRIEFSIPTAMPDIKATNITQKLGGMVTYTQRYLEMVAFGITDNNLDLDSQDNTGEKIKTVNDPTFQKLLKGIEDGKYTEDKMKSDYSLKETQLNELNRFMEVLEAKLEAKINEEKTK
jgi:hypothetical protein